MKTLQSFCRTFKDGRKVTDLLASSSVVFLLYLAIFPTRPGDAFQVAAMPEGPSADGFHAFRDSDFLYGALTVKRPVADGFH